MVFSKFEVGQNLNNAIISFTDKSPYTGMSEFLVKYITDTGYILQIELSSGNYDSLRVLLEYNDTSTTLFEYIYYFNDYEEVLSVDLTPYKFPSDMGTIISIEGEDGISSSYPFYEIEIRRIYDLLHNIVLSTILLRNKIKKLDSYWSSEVSYIPTISNTKSGYTVHSGTASSYPSVIHIINNMIRITIYFDKAKGAVSSGTTIYSRLCTISFVDTDDVLDTSTASASSRVKSYNTIIGGTGPICTGAILSWSKSKASGASHYTWTADVYLGAVAGGSLGSSTAAVNDMVYVFNCVCTRNLR